jgi:hypothetical protein
MEWMSCIIWKMIHTPRHKIEERLSDEMKDIPNL